LAELRSGLSALSACIADVAFAPQVSEKITTAFFKFGCTGRSELGVQVGGSYWYPSVLINVSVSRAYMFPALQASRVAQIQLQLPSFSCSIGRSDKFPSPMDLPFLSLLIWWRRYEPRVCQGRSQPRQVRLLYLFTYNDADLDLSCQQWIWITTAALVRQGDARKLRSDGRF
jgi:hypothetical protein